jgi:F-type H+-transporting ATPase subunit b
MAASGHTVSGTAVAHKQPAAFPPFDTTTYPSQFFWLAVTFAVLFVVMWQLGVKRVGSNIIARKQRIASDLEAAEAHRRNAEKAAADYEAALAAARSRAHAMAEENSRLIQGEIDAAKAKADGDAKAATDQAKARVAQLQSDAAQHIKAVASAAAGQIVVRLIGVDVSEQDRVNAVNQVSAR